MLVDENRRNEVAVQFHLVNGQVTQIGQRTVASAEIIDGDPNAVAPQLLQNRLRAFHVVEEQVLGDLDG